MDHPRHHTPCGVVELRQYTMQPGQRDTLIAIFERHFIEAQEAVGMTIFGQFRDRARADRFVFIRGFRDMASRHDSLERFYGGDVWSEQSDAANATMIDWHDVLLLRPPRPDTMLDVDASDRPALGDARTAPSSGALPYMSPPTATVFAGIHGLRAPADDATVKLFETHAAPVLRAQGLRIDALLVTEPAPNTFTRLPVREGEHVFVWVATRGHGGEATSGTLSAALSGVGDLAALARDADPLIVLELEPTSRSLLGHQRTGTITETSTVAQNLRR